VFISICLLVGLVYVARLFYIQVLDDSYKLSANNNVLRYVTEFPARGIIYDRKGRQMVTNEAAYDLMVVPRQVKDLDTLDLCNILDISKKEFIERMLKVKTYSRYKPSIFEAQIDKETYAVLQEKLYKFSGFYCQTRTLRKYKDRAAAHILGYVGEVNEKMVKESPYYNQGDYIGMSGMEKSYEEYLRGKKGVRVVMVDVHGREKGNYMGGQFDTIGKAGARLTSTLDLELQKYGEKLMQNKIGSVVAIEPKTGEILALVSSPAYDPNKLVGRVRSKNYRLLALNPLKPLFNRALMAMYPPGSTFKIANALIGQQEKVTFASTAYSCNKGISYGSLHIGCHPHSSPLQLRQSIQYSCNAYYCQVFRSIIDSRKTTREGYDMWRDHVMSFGFGKKFNTDLPNELKGIVPTGDYYDKYHGKNRWKSLTVISLSIGQGELGATPLQMANMTAIVANQGYYMSPHIVKAIDGKPFNKYKIRNETHIDSSYFRDVIEGMQMVVEAGTAARSKIPGIVMCGKTGTAQNPHGKDHSLFVAFAPKENPQIAIAVMVENAGFGATYAAPIASLMIEKYLKDSITNKTAEEFLLKTNLLPDSLRAKMSVFQADSIKIKKQERLQDSLKRKEREDQIKKQVIEEERKKEERKNALKLSRAHKEAEKQDNATLSKEPSKKPKKNSGPAPMKRQRKQAKQRDL
jgi:penicillin-binding protein 2